MLEQVFVNLVENAIRYSEQGGITVRLVRQVESVVLEVSDAGVGIPAEHIPRVFERFYVVDKPRSRETGGMCREESGNRRRQLGARHQQISGVLAALIS